MPIDDFVPYITREYDPNVIPPRAPCVWVNSVSNEFWISKGTSSINDWVPSGDTHSSDLNNPHSVSAAQVGNNNPVWNAIKINGVELNTSTPPFDGAALRYSTFQGKMQWQSVDTGSIRVNTSIKPIFSSSHTFPNGGGAIYFTDGILVTYDSLTTRYKLSLQPEWRDHVTKIDNPHSVSANQVGNSVPQWNASEFNGVPLIDVLSNDGDFYVNDPDQGGLVAKNIYTFNYEYVGYQTVQYNNSTITPEQLIPTDAGDVDEGYSNDPNGFFDPSTNPGFLTIGLTGVYEYCYTANYQNTTTASVVGRFAIEVDGVIDERTEGAISVASTAAGRDVTVSKSGFITLTELSLVRLVFWSTVAASNARVIENTAMFKLKLRSKL